MAGPTVSGGGVVGPSPAELIQNSLKQQNDMLSEMSRSMQIYRELNDRRNQVQFSQTWDMLKNIADQTYGGDIQAVFDATPGLGERVLKLAGFGGARAKDLASRIAKLPTSSKGYDVLGQMAVKGDFSAEEFEKAIEEEEKYSALPASSPLATETAYNPEAPSQETPAAPVASSAPTKKPGKTYTAPNVPSPLETETAYTPATKAVLPVVPGAQQGGLAGTAIGAQEALKAFAPTGVASVARPLQGGMSEVQKAAMQGAVPQAQPVASAPTPVPSQPASDTSDEAFWSWMYKRGKVANPTGRPETVQKLKEGNPATYQQFLKEAGSAAPVAQATPPVSQETPGSRLSSQSTWMQEAELSEDSKRKVSLFKPGLVGGFGSEGQEKAYFAKFETPQGSRLSTQAEESLKTLPDDVATATNPNSKPAAVNQALKNIRQATGNLTRLNTWADLKKANPKDVAKVYAWRIQNDPAFQDVTSRTASSPETIARLELAQRSAESKTELELKREVELGKISADEANAAVEYLKTQHLLNQLGLDEARLALENRKIDLEKAKLDAMGGVSGLLSEAQRKQLEAAWTGMDDIIARVSKGGKKPVSEQDIIKAGFGNQWATFKELAKGATQSITGVDFAAGQVYNPGWFGRLRDGLSRAAFGGYEPTGATPRNTPAGGTPSEPTPDPYAAVKDDILSQF